jgi:hypothetical protein
LRVGELPRIPGRGTPRVRREDPLSPSPHLLESRDIHGEHGGGASI